MNIFIRMGNSIVRFFQSDLFRFILKTGQEILTRVLGQVGSTIQQIALEEVTKAENTPGLTGLDKYNMAYQRIRDRLGDPTIKENAINLAIEIAVTAFQSAKR